MQQEFRTNLNLLPRQHRRRALIRDAVTLWAVVWTVGLTGASFFLWSAERKGDTLEAEVSRYERMVGPLEVLAAELEPMRARLVKLQGEEAAADNLEDHHPALALLGILSRAAKACNERLQIRECQLQRRAANDGAASAPRQLLTIRGAALDLACLTEFHATLRDCQMFDRVEPKSTNQESIGDTDGYVFHVDCVY